MWTSRQVTRSAETDTDEPAERPIVLLERNRADNEDFLDLDIELPGGECARLGSGGRLIRSEDPVLVSHDYHATPRR